MSKFYTSTEVMDNETLQFNNYIDSLNKNFTTKKVYLISLNKKLNQFKIFGVFKEFNEAYKNNYAKLINSEKILSTFKDFNTLDFDYYNSNLNFDMSKFKQEFYILLKNNNITLLSKKFKNLYPIKTLRFAFKEDVLADSTLKVDIEPKAKSLIIPDFKKLQY
jgi:hypothetical protein